MFHSLGRAARLLTVGVAATLVAGMSPLTTMPSHAVAAASTVPAPKRFHLSPADIARAPHSAAAVKQASRRSVGYHKGFLGTQNMVWPPAGAVPPDPGGATNPSLEADVEWSVGHHDIARTGDASWEGGVFPPLNLAWQGAALDKVQTNPAVVDDVAYFGGDATDTRAYAVDLENGNLQWTASVGSVLGSPAVAGPSVYVLASGFLFELNRYTGAINWQFPAAGNAPLGESVGGPVIHDGVIYFGSLDSNLYAVDATTGALIWAAATPEPISADITVADGKIFVPSGPNEWVSAFDQTTHNLVWQDHLYTCAACPPGTIGSGVSVSNFTVYVAGTDQNLWALNDLNGTQGAFGPIALGAPAQDTPVIGGGSIYIGTNGGVVDAFNFAGGLLWSHTVAPGQLMSSPIYAAGVVYASSTSNSLYSLDATVGSLKWAYGTGGQIFDAPAIASNHVVVGSDDHNVYAFTPALPGDTTTPAPPIGHLYGVNGDQLYSPEPVNTSTGNYVLQATDVAESGRGVPTVFGRTYNSLDATTPGPLGNGWTYTFNMGAIVGAGQVTVRWPDGRQDLYTGSGPYTGPPDGHDTLSNVAGGGYQLVTKAHVTYRFSSAGQLLSVADASGNPTTLGYTGGNLTSVTDAANRTMGIAYGANGQISTVSAALGRTWTYGYDANLNLTGVTDPNGNAWTYGYDAAHHLTTVTDPDGNLSVRNVYNAAGQVTDQFDANSDHTTYAYAAGSTTVTNPLGRATTYTFDADSRTTQVVDAAGGVWKYVYDGAANLVAAVDPTGATVRRTYDGSGNLVASWDPLGHKTAFAYDANSDLTKVTDVKNGVATVVYDAAFRITDVTSPAGLHSHTVYNADGTVASTTNGAGQTTTNAYDANGFPTGATDPLHRTALVHVNAAGQQVSITDPAGETTTYGYDAGGRLTSVTDPLNDVWSYGHDRTGRETSVTDPNNHVTRYAYDPRGVLRSATDPLNRQASYTYDAGGRLVTMTNRRGASVTFGYSPTDQLNSIQAPGVATMTYAKDAAGRLTSITDGTGTIAYTYDAPGRLSSEQRSLNSVNLAYQYDSLGRRNSLTWTDNGGFSGALAYTYDGDGRPTSLSDGSGNVTTYQYDAAGRLSGVVEPAAAEVASTLKYDAAGELTEIAHSFTDTLALTTPNDYSLSTWDYQYDAAGRKTQAQRKIVQPGGAVLTSTMATFAYDAAGRLTANTNTDPVAPPTANAGFTYDGAGNRTSLQLAGHAVKTSTYDAANELTSDGIASYGYDADGNLTSVIAATQALRTYTYDNLGRMTGTATGPTSVSYGYDGLDRRVLRTDTLGTANNVFDGSDLLEVLGPAPVRAQQESLGGRVLNRSNGALVTKFYLPDGSGNVGDVVGGAAGYATTIGRYSYDAFGNSGFRKVGNAPNTAPDHLAFAGLYGAQGDGALVDMSSRFYSPTQGRFTSNDPIQGFDQHPASMNRYAYAGSDPVNQADPSGRCPSGGGSTGGAIDCSVVNHLLAATSVGLNVLGLIAGLAGDAIDATVAGVPVGVVLNGVSVAANLAAAGIDVQQCLTGHCDVVGVFLDILGAIPLVGPLFDSFRVAKEGGSITEVLIKLAEDDPRLVKALGEGGLKNADAAVGTAGVAEAVNSYLKECWHLG